MPCQRRSIRFVNKRKANKRADAPECPCHNGHSCRPMSIQGLSGFELGGGRCVSTHDERQGALSSGFDTLERHHLPICRRIPSLAR
jgi:hypothetical protein